MSTISRQDERQYRLSLLRSFALFLFVVLWIQFFNKSVINHATALSDARKQQMTKEEIVPKRGTIYAQSNDGLFPVATTSEKYTITVVPKNTKDKTAAAKLLAQNLGKDEKEIFDAINNDKLYISPLAKRIEKEPAQKIIDAKIPGIVVIPEYVRYYLEGSLAAHALGFVNYENTGSYGVEGYYDEQLKGYAGSIIAEKDRKGRFISIGSKTNAQDGDSLVLSIDHNVQFIAESKLKGAIDKYGATGGQILIVDVKTGDILAMASLPSFDPNKFNEVKQEDQSIFLNQTIGSVYEPGSIMKPVVIAAGIDAGKIKAEDEDVYSNMVVVSGYEIHTAQDKAFGKETITQILENSDNVAMVALGSKIGNETLFEYFKNFGFGANYGIDSSGETTGKLLPLKQWRDIHRATMSFGQGISVTPLQILMAYQAIGNDGTLVQPRLVKGLIRSDGTKKDIEPKILRSVVKPETAEQVRRMLISVVERGHGKKAKIAGYTIGGKTGTAQIPKKEGGGYEENAHIGSFVGLVPGDKPQFAMLVKLDRPTNVEFAESSAAPTFGEVASYLLQYYHIPKEIE